MNQSSEKNLGDFTKRNPDSQAITSQRGFTVLELMVNLVLIGILAAQALLYFREYRKQVYYSMSEQSLKDVRTAMEAALINQDALTRAGQILWMWQDTPGLPTTVDGRTLLPGYVIPKDNMVYAYLNPVCNSGWCLEQYAYVRHCKADKYLYWYTFRNGYQVTWRDIPAWWSC